MNYRVPKSPSDSSTGESSKSSNTRSPMSTYKSPLTPCKPSHNPNTLLLRKNITKHHRLLSFGFALKGVLVGGTLRQAFEARSSMSNESNWVASSATYRKNICFHFPVSRSLVISGTPLSKSIPIPFVVPCLSALSISTVFDISDSLPTPNFSIPISIPHCNNTSRRFHKIHKCRPDIGIFIPGSQTCFIYFNRSINRSSLYRSSAACWSITAKIKDPSVAGWVSDWGLEVPEELVCGIEMRMNFRSIWFMIFAVSKSDKESVMDCFVEIGSRRGIGNSVDV